MSDRRYEVYEVCKHGSVAPHEGWPLHAQVWGDYVTCDGGTRLDFIPDALVEEAAKRMAPEVQYDAVTGERVKPRVTAYDRIKARAALSVLFPGEEE